MALKDVIFDRENGKIHFIYQIPYIQTEYVIDAFTLESILENYINNADAIEKKVSEYQEEQNIP